MKAKALIAALALLLAAGFTARAEGSWTVEETSYNSSTKTTTFTISRTETTYEQKVLYRTVGLTAYNGQHFTETYGELTFQAGTPSMTVQVQEKTPTAGAYLYQNGNTTRSYKMEVTDRAGFLLADCTRTMSNGSSFSASKVSDSITNLVYFSGSNYASSLSSSKYVDVAYTPPSGDVATSGTLSGYVLIDDSYDYANKAATVSTSTLINSTGATASYLNEQNYKILATVCFTEKERDDGYQYIQIIAGSSSATYDTGYDPNGSVNDPVNSVYKACFELSDGSNAEGKQFFPHRYDYATKTAETSAGINITEFSQTNGHLWQQKYKSGYSYNGSGSLMFPANTSYITTRFDAGGDNDDTWGYKDLFVRMTLIDAQAPTMLSIRANPGRHAKGNSFYVSLAFSEIVTSTDATLSTSWGKMTLLSGSGTNVLTFKGTIKADADGALNISGKGGTITDLAGREFTPSINQDNLANLDADLAYTIGDFKMEGGAYLITCHDDLNGLAGYVNAGNNCSGLTFRQVTNIVFPYTTNWNNSSSTENNYIAIGKSGSSYRFHGTYDGEGHTVSGIRIYKGGNSSGVDNYQGLFGVVGGSGTVRNVNLSDSRITGFDSVGGIAGFSFGKVEDCSVTANVCLHIVQVQANYFGGIVGNNRGNIYRSVSRACITLKSGITPTSDGFGGIAGYNYGSNTITDCIAEGVTIPNTNGRGVILGHDESGAVTLTRNYYLGCTVAGVTNATGVGQGTVSSTSTSDHDGAQPLWAVTLPAHASLVRTGTNLPVTGYATYDNGADIAGVPYAKATSTLNLSYDSAAISQGHEVVITATETSSGNPVAVTDNGNHTYTIASMPAADITVTATEVPVVSYIDADGNEQSVVNPTQIVAGTTRYGNSANTEAWYYVSGDVTISGTKGVRFLDQQVNIILCDGATLTSNATDGGYGGIQLENGSLAIYAQAGGTGSIVATSNDFDAIFVIDNLNLNGGYVSCTTQHGIDGISSYDGDITIRRGYVTSMGSTYGIFSSNNLTILGGTVNATAPNSGLYSYAGDVSILGGNVTASGETGIVAGNNQDRAITLGCATAADRITASSYACATLKVQDGQTLTDGTAIYSSTLSPEEKAAIAGKTLHSAAGAVFYIDADGVQRVCVGATQITAASCNYGNSSNAEGWYYVSGEITLNSTLNINDRNVHLILCDGANLTITSTNSYGLAFRSNGSIYGQSGGSGILDINSLNNALTNSGGPSAICINGGEIRVDSSGADGIYCYGDVIIRRGIVNATGYYNGIRGYGITILGGQVTATETGTNGSGIFGTSNFITLGWSNSGDSITASSYLLGGSDGALLIATGQALTDGTNTYTGFLSTEQIAAIAGKTLLPAENPSDDIIELSARKSKIGGIIKYFTTFYHPTKNYQLSKGAQAFTLKKNTDNGNKEFYLVGDGSIVPANCAVIIFADKSVVTLTATNETAAPVGTNILQGVGVATAVSTLVTGTQKVYVISGNNNSIGLYEYTGTTIPAYKAYIIVE